MLKRFFFLIEIMLSAGLMAQNIHVSVNGSDTNGNGSQELPYATITYAATQAQPGDTVFVHAGTYHNDDFNDGDIWQGSSLASIKCHGTEDHYIVFTPYPGDEVLLEFDGTYGVVIQNAAYVKFEQFELKGIADNITEQEAIDAWGLYKDENGVIHDIAEEMGIDITDPGLWGQTLSKPETPTAQRPSYYNGRALVALNSQHIIITKNIVRDVPSAAIRVQKSDYVTVSENRVFHNTYWTTLGVGAITVAQAQNFDGNTDNGVKIRLERNEVFENENRMYSWNPNKNFIKFVIDEGTGLFLTRNNDTYNYGYILIANNLSYKNGASGIVVHKTNRAIVEQNTVYHNGTTNGDSKAGGIGVNTVNDVIIRNNISWAIPQKAALYKLANPVDNLVMESNIVYNENGAHDVVTGLPSTGWMEINPLLIAPADNNFKLKPSSPAIDNGVNNTIVTDDFSGLPRNDGFHDIGAYEFSNYVGIGENLKNDLTVFPVPAGEILILKDIPQGTDRLKILDMQGRELKTWPVTGNEKNVQLNIEDLENGLYILQAGMHTQKFIKK